MRWFSIAALVLLAVCYLGILLAPNLSIHLATDVQEPQLAGDWRGSFGHKNVAAAMMAMLLFLGIYIVRSGAWLSGIAIIGAVVAVSAERRRQELAGAVLCGADADFTRRQSFARSGFAR